MQNKYFMDENTGTFHITDPNTGKYWYNHLWNKSGYHLSVSQVGHGMSRLIGEDAKNVILNKDEYRYLYLRDEDNKEYWNIGISPTMETVENYNCEHGQEFTKISSVHDNIEASWMITVPQIGTHEIWKVCINNKSEKIRNISVFPSIKFDLDGFVQPSYYNATTTSETFFLDKINGVFCRSKNPHLPFECCSGYLASSAKVSYYDGWIEKFNGEIGNFARPEILLKGENCTNSKITVRDRGAVLQNITSIEPGETKTIYYIAGFSNNPQTVVCEYTRALIDAESICNNVVKNGIERFGTLRVKTPDARVNNIMNFWAQKQVSFCMIGKKAVRDNAQIAMGILNFDSDLAKESIVECLCHQYSDGHALLLWSPFISHELYSDPPMWLILSVCEYVKETGNIDFLKEELSFYDFGSSTVYEHLKLAVKWMSANYGPHQLPKIQYADWNDALNIPDEDAESIFMAMGFAFALKELIGLASEVKDVEYINYITLLRRNLVDKTNEIAWNGDYYIRALSKFGNIGDKDNIDGGRMYLNPQVWAILGDVVPQNYLNKLFKSIESMETEYGTPLCAPAYKSYNPVVGRMSGMLPGVYENGGVYNHACGFKIMAECKMGKKDKALQTMLAIIPDGKLNPSSLTTTEPYVFTNCYLLHDSAQLVVGFSWQTGTSAWALRGFYEGILGLIRTYKGLQIKPQISATWPYVSVTRVFRGSQYDIEYFNNGSGNIKISVDEKEILGDILPLFTDGLIHKVKVEMF